MTNAFRSGPETAKELAAIAEKKSQLSVPAMLLLGALAGIYIGFGGIAATTVLANADGMSVAVAKWLAGSVFCLGLILVVIPGSELFTGNILMFAALPAKRVPMGKLLRNWAFVYVGNFAGAVLLALAMYYTGLMGTPEAQTPLGAKAAAIADTRIAFPFVDALVRGILCNILVCLAVILAVSARDVAGKILGIYFPIMVFVLAGFEHSIANMYFLSAGLMAKGTFFGPAFWSIFHNLIPVTIGNIIGGLLVVMLHPAQAKRFFRSAKPPEDNA